MATKTWSDTPTFALPGGPLIAPEVVDVDLCARVTKCEEALEDAVLQLARFYNFLGRHAEATACRERGIRPGRAGSA